MLTVLVIVFLCGAAVGATTMRAYLHARMFPMPEQHAIEQARRYGLSHLKTELNLTPKQESTITQILDNYGKYYETLEDQRDDVAEVGRQHILDTLNDKQKKRFNKIFAEKH
ncbi:MAG TPA: hypothetical protein VF283_02010 [Bryobacteraceae bacterium]